MKHHPPRHDSLNISIDQALRLTRGVMESMGVPPGVNTGIRPPEAWSAACQIVRLGLELQSADIMDEHLTGIGEAIEEQTGVQSIGN